MTSQDDSTRDAPAAPTLDGMERLREDIARGMVAEVNAEIAAEGDDEFRYEPDYYTADQVVSILAAKRYEVRYRGIEPAGAPSATNADRGQA